MRASPIRVQCELMSKSATESLMIMDLPPTFDGDEEALQGLLGPLAKLSADGILKLNTANRPDALIKSLQNRNYDVQVRQWKSNAWDVEVRASRIPVIVDLRKLEAPLPLEKVLMACSQLSAGELYLARLPRVPVMLFPHLDTRGLHWQVHEEFDQSALLLVRKTA